MRETMNLSAANLQRDTGIIEDMMIETGIGPRDAEEMRGMIGMLGTGIAAGHVLCRDPGRLTAQHRQNGGNDVMIMNLLQVTDMIDHRQQVGDQMTNRIHWKI